MTKSALRTATRCATLLPIALSAGAVLLGLLVPPLPLLRRGAYRLAALFGLVWIAALIVFFTAAYGPGLLAHMGLWLLATAAILFPNRLTRVEGRLPPRIPRRLPSVHSRKANSRASR